MGTSQSSVGPNGRSPLLPSWVDNNQAQLQPPDPQRLKGLRQAIGRAVRGGGRDDVRKALGHYARKASGGKHTAVQKLGKITQAGASLFGIFSDNQQQQYSVNLHSLNGQPCDEAINPVQIAEAENDLRQLIREVVDVKLAPKFTDDVCQLTIEQMQEIQNQAILEIWEEWEDY